MLIPILQSLLDRDLVKLSAEIALYRDETHLWRVEKDIPNSAGNLCLHLVGNLNAFIGAQLGQSGYIRNREAEFSLKDVPRATLLQQIEATRQVLKTTLDNLSEADLQLEYPIPVFGHPMSTGYFLIHLATHLAYHLGQVNYHRRLLD